MKKKEFEQHLLEAYVSSRKHELISEESAREEFNKMDLSAYNWDYIKFVEQIALKCFMYNCQSASIDVVRQFLIHDFVVGDLFWEE